MKLLFILAMVLLGTQAFSSDPLNAYRYNRKNVINGNGEIEKKTWFEWWYYKVVLPDSGESFFFVYGVVNPWDHNLTYKGTRAAMEMGDFSAKKQVALKVPVSEFDASYDETYVKVGNYVATDRHIEGEIDENGERYSWNIDIEKEWGFNATGWATGRGITNIEWYPAQASARCSGEVVSGQKHIKFKNAPCYQDRNWGYSFPKWWTWIVSNHFEKSPGTTLAIGGGRPKFFGRELMEGVAIGLNHKGKEYSWRPNDMDRVKVNIKFGKWEVEAVNKEYKIEVSAYAPKEKFMDLQFMTPTGEIFHDYEALTGKVVVKLYRKPGFLFSNWVQVEQLESNFAGIEYGSKEIYDLEEIFNSEKSLIP